MMPLVNIINRLPIGVVKSISALQWRSRWLQTLYMSTARFYLNHDDIIQRGPAKGLRFNSGPARNAGFLLGTYEPEVQKIYASLIRPGMTVYDVGANVGFLGVLAATLVGSSGTVVCFEPLPANVEAIKHNAALNSFDNLRILPEALGRSNNVAEFLVSGNVGWGRLAGIKSPAEQTGSVPVLVRSLDTEVEELKLPLPDLIKIDIEGGEVGMLEGSLKVLKECRPMLLIELHGTNEAVDRILRDVEYSSYVLGESRSIVQARWDAFVISAPSGDISKCETARTLAERAVLGR